jgi:glycosyltransferase involved in cell wall biosynthesis
MEYATHVQNEDPSGGAAPAYSVVIPFYNEEANARALLCELAVVLEDLGRPYEVILVEDGSTDGTRDVLAAIAASWPQCRIIGFAQNQGQAAALYCGMRLARGPVVVTLDGDGQNVPADIPRLLARLHAGDADIVAGVRVDRHDSILRLGMSRLANAVRSRVLGDGVADTGCGLKAMRREVAAELIPIDTVYSFMPALAVAAGFRVVQEPVAHRPRVGGDSKYGFGRFFWRPALDMLGVCWFTHRRVRSLEALRALAHLGPETR